MRRITLFTLIWFLAGYIPALLLARFIHLPFQLFQCGLFSLLVGLLLLASFIRTERGRRLFYEGPAEDEDGDPFVGCLWFLPLFIIMAALAIWLPWYLAEF